MMNFLLVLVAAPILVLGTKQEFNPFQKADKWIEIVNNDPDSTWKAGRNFNPNLPASYVKSLLGTILKNGDHSLPVAEPINDIDDSEIPKSFDARKKWPHCRIHVVRDQGDCGSCWATAAAGSFSDRLCIASEGRVNVSLSHEYLTACCSQCGNGCFGGFNGPTWSSFESTGVVTGGNYDSHEGCQPYSKQSCEHHTQGLKPPCPSLHEDKTPKCHNKCTNKHYKIPFEKDFWRTKNSYMVHSSVEAIQKEILRHGPVGAGFIAYDDFLTYKSGVYQVSEGAESVSGHSVKLIGWGVEDDVDYWLVQNSWNEDWGDKGYFKIIRGYDECGFESNIATGIPDV